MSHTTLILALAVVASGVVITGCGDDGDRTDTKSATSATIEPSGKSGGGERSIEEFGTEATGSNRAELLAAFHSYLDAVAARDYPAACSRLTAAAQQSLKQLLPESFKEKACQVALPSLLAPTAAATARSQAQGKVTKVRLEGRTGFVVLHAPGAALYQMPMALEGGQWKAGLVTASVLVPSAATLGQ